MKISISVETLDNKIYLISGSVSKITCPESHSTDCKLWLMHIPWFKRFQIQVCILGMRQVRLGKLSCPSSCPFLLLPAYPVKNAKAAGGCNGSLLFLRGSEKLSNNPVQNKLHHKNITSPKIRLVRKTPGKDVRMQDSGMAQPMISIRNRVKNWQMGGIASQCNPPLPFYMGVQ